MAQASNPDIYIYEGIWVNWARGPALGLTLTLNPKNASILSPALAILISLAGAQLWRLMQISVHQIRATPKSRPMIYHQTQVILRNSTTDLNTLWQLIRLGLAWKQFLPIAGLGLWTLVHFSLILAFGLLSSWLLESDNEVLSKSPWCGTFNQTYLKTVYAPNYTDPKRTALVTEYNEHLYSRYATVQQHVDICRDSSRGCTISNYRPNKLNWTTSYVANECPFNSSICHPDAGTMSMDTGYLSSHSDFGFNAAEEDRISLRMLSKCSPLDNANHTSLWQNTSTADGTRLLADASYGKSAYSSRNSTYSLWWKPLDCEQRLTTTPYILISHFAQPGGSVASGTGTFDPIPELRLSNADLSLITLAYNDAYLNPVEDPWYSAKQPTNESTKFCARSNTTLYVRERPLTSMACTQQWQICNTDKNSAWNASCIPLSGLTQAYKQLMSPSPGITLTDRQNATMQRILNAGTQSTFFYAVLALSQTGSLPIRARARLNSVSNAQSPALPSDQWQTETQYWMDLLLGYLQQKSLDMSTGQFAASTSQINVSLPSINKANAGQDAAYWLCQAQVITSDTYRNFNFCALLITSIICVIVIILGLTIEDCVACCRMRRLNYSGSPGGSKQDMWIANADLQMLRTIDEMKNRTNWTLSRNGVSRTHPGYEVSINDLMAEGYDIEEGKGIVSPAVKRMQIPQLNSSNRWIFNGNNGSSDIGDASSSPFPWQEKLGPSTIHLNELSPTHKNVYNNLHVNTHVSNPYFTAGDSDVQYSKALLFSNSIPSSIDLDQRNHHPYQKAQFDHSESMLPESMRVRMRVDELMQGTSSAGHYHAL